MNLSDKDLGCYLQLVLWEIDGSMSTWRGEYLQDLATRLQAEMSQRHPSSSTERRLDVQRDAMSDHDRDKIGYEDHDGTLGLRDRRG